MPSRPARLLCVGNELDHLRTRCAVLSHSGYDAQSATVPEAETLLSTEQFDLIIVSAWLSEPESEPERNRILWAAGSTPSLLLQGFITAEELLAEVERLLSPVNEM